MRCFHFNECRVCRTPPCVSVLVALSSRDKKNKKMSHHVVRRGFKIAPPLLRARVPRAPGPHHVPTVTYYDVLGVKFNGEKKLSRALSPAKPFSALLHRDSALLNHLKSARRLSRWFTESNCFNRFYRAEQVPLGSTTGAASSGEAVKCSRRTCSGF